MPKRLPLLERYGGAGPFELPPDHDPAMKVSKGGSCCANCRFLGEDGLCEEEHYVRWHGDGELDAPPDEFCSDWWMPKAKK